MVVDSPRGRQFLKPRRWSRSMITWLVAAAGRYGQQLGSSTAHRAPIASRCGWWYTFMPLRSDSISPACRSWVRWWLTVDSVKLRAAASSLLFSSPLGELNRNDMIFTLAGSASALSRSATCSASTSLIGPAATGAQHTGADISTVGSVLGMGVIMPEGLTYIKEVGMLNPAR